MDENVNEITSRLDGLVEQLAAMERRDRRNTKPPARTVTAEEASSRRTVARMVGLVLFALVMCAATLAGWYWALQYGIVLPR